MRDRQRDAAFKPQPGECLIDSPDLISPFGHEHMRQSDEGFERQAIA